MITENNLRIDKWLWAVRIFKTRSMAAGACRKGKVIIDGVPVKPSRQIKVHEVVQVRKAPVTYSFRVTGLLAKRLSAKKVLEYVENITPENELNKLKYKDTFFIRRKKGAGRPTKKERRTLDKLQNTNPYKPSKP